MASWRLALTHLKPGFPRANLYFVDTAAIISAWLFGVVSGALAVAGVATAVSGRMILNPNQIDWSEGEARALGLVIAGQGVLIGLLSLIEVLEWASYRPMVPPVVLIPIVFSGFFGVALVGRHHDSRNPIKKWWR